MSKKAEKTSRYSSQQSWWQFLIRHPLLLKVVTWLGSLSLLANANVSWAEVQPLRITSQSAVPVLIQSKNLPIISPSQPLVGQSEFPISVTNQKLHSDLLTAQNFTVAVQAGQTPATISCNSMTSQLVSSLCSQVRPRSQKLARRVMPAVEPLPIVQSNSPLARLTAPVTRPNKRPLAVSPALPKKVALELPKPQPLAPLSIPGAVSIYVAPPQTNVIPRRTVEPLSSIPKVSKLSVPNLAPLPVVQPPTSVAQNRTTTPATMVPIANDQVATGLIYPLASPAPVTSNFGWRVHPITGNRRFHAGVDLGAPSGAAVVAAATGRVVVANWHGGYGKTVVIEHNGKLQTLYGHLSEILVQEGQEISQGTVIGRVGSTGNSTGPHLHFETHAATNDGWVAVDPGPDVQYALDSLRQAIQFTRRDLVPSN